MTARQTGEITVTAYRISPVCLVCSAVIRSERLFEITVLVILSATITLLLQDICSLSWCSRVHACCFEALQLCVHIQFLAVCREFRVVWCSPISPFVVHSKISEAFFFPSEFVTFCCLLLLLVLLALWPTSVLCPLNFSMSSHILPAKRSL